MIGFVIYVHLLRLLAPLLLLTVLCGSAAVVMGRTVPRAAQLVFMQRAGYDASIFVIDIERGTRAALFTVPPALPADLPRLSADGQRIIFEFWAESGLALRALDLARRSLYATDPALQDRLPGWSPDGTQIAFWSNRMSPSVRSNRWQNWNFYVVDVNTTTIRQITSSLSLLPYHLPLWSPDSQRILLNYWRPNQGAGMYLVELATGSTRTLTGEIETGSDLAWSPDSAHIAFRANPNRDSEIYLLHVETNTIENLTDHAGNDFEPAWSPDGRQIAFTSNRDGRGEIYVMNADGSQVRRITAGGGWHPIWSPDGTRIAYMSSRTGNNAYHVVNVDSSADQFVIDTQQHALLGWLAP
ncbi:MAG: DPP IV N-terminal domain-containing protein [bacterium]|nr:DPP IV N-terminal domain-containing protein [bacterium]